MSQLLIAVIFILLIFLLQMRYEIYLQNKEIKRLDRVLKNHLCHGTSKTDKRTTR
jgi:hypothetical protein